MIIRCPSCENEIPESDFNISTDIALCRKCDKVYKTSDLMDSVSGKSISKMQIPKNLRMKEHFDGEELIYHRKSPILFFMVPFFLIWSGGSMTGIYIYPLLNGKLETTQMLFGLPFLLGSVFLLYVILHMFFGEISIRLSSGELSVFNGLWGLGRRRRYSINELKSVSIRHGSCSVNDQKTDSIFLEKNDGDKFEFGGFMKPESQKFMAAYIASKISRK